MPAAAKWRPENIILTKLLPLPCLTADLQCGGGGGHVAGAGERLPQLGQQVDDEPGLLEEVRVVDQRGVGQHRDQAPGPGHMVLHFTALCMQ